MLCLLTIPTFKSSHPPSFPPFYLTITHLHSFSHKKRLTSQNSTILHPTHHQLSQLTKEPSLASTHASFSPLATGSPSRYRWAYDSSNGAKDSANIKRSTAPWGVEQQPFGSEKLEQKGGVRLLGECFCGVQVYKQNIDNLYRYSDIGIHT